MDKLMDLERRVRDLEAQVERLKGDQLGSQARPLQYTYFMDPKARGRVLKVSLDAANDAFRFERS